MKQTFGLYLHIPYCVRKCPYCDFNSFGIGSSAAIPEDRYVQALIGELQTAAFESSWRGRTCHSIFFGGGTPSLFSPTSFERILEAINRCFVLSPTTEITMETNPGTVFEDLDRERLRAIRQAGVNRLSLGVQSFSARKREILGRWHNTEEIMRAVTNVHEAGFSNFSFDFIFGVADETPEEWESDLRQAIALGPRHVSAYGLTIEPGTEFGKQKKRGTLRELDEGVQAELYIQTNDLLAQAGYSRYEISNYAKPGFECRHNLGYWSGEDYLGLGAGAHGYLSEEAETRRWVNLRGPEDYMTSVESRGVAIQHCETLNEEQREIEFFFLKLRTSRGFSWEEHARRFPLSEQKKFTSVYRSLAEQDLLCRDGDRVLLSEKGFLFSDTAFSAFACAVSE